MSLYYHIGSSGAGKTTGVQNRIIEEAEKEKDRSFLFIVPEQFTLQTQREILSKSRTGGMLNIDALSFARLAYRVFEELGVTLPQVLEDTGKSMIVKKLLLEHQDELTIYKSKVKKQGFAEEMKSLIAEFYQYGIDLEHFETMKKTAGDRDILKSKLHDIEIIYKAFAKFINGRFVMNEEVLDRMCEVAGESELLKGSVIVLDGFTGFTPSQYNCIDKLMKYARDIHVVLTLSPNLVSGFNQGDGSLIEKKDSLFELSLKTIDKLEQLATKNNIQTGIITYNDEKGRYRNNPSLAHLEQNIFRYPYKKSTDHSAITLLSAKDTEEEADFIVAKIRELVFENSTDAMDVVPKETGTGTENVAAGMRFENIAVLTGDLAAYGPVLERKLLKAGIPHFIDQKKNIAGTSAVEFIDSVLDIILSDFSYESVFRFLKAGFTDIDRDDISRTENFVYEHGIKGYWRWSRVFKAKKEEPETENSVRVKVLDLLCEIKKSEEPKEKPTVKERLTLLYSLLDKCEVELKLYNLSETLKNSENPKDRIKGTELGQVFKSIVKVFERINSLLGEERLSLNEFKEILDTGFNEAKLRAIPGGVDSVVVGDIERTRLDNKNVIFFAGCNDSVIPGNKSKGSLLNEFDRELFADNDIELSPTQRDNASLSEFYMYLALTKPSQRLYLSYSKKCGDEKEGRPAYIFGRIIKLYEGLEVQKISRYEQDDIYRILGSDKGLSAVIAYLRENASKGNVKGEAGNYSDSNKDLSGDVDGFKKSVISSVIYSIIRDENPKLIDRLIHASMGKRLTSNLTGEAAEKLYGKVIVGSITRLQQFAQCAFSHFAEYGLKLKERQEYRIGGLELGLIYHDALKKYAEGLKKEKMKWADCLGTEREAREASAIESALSEYQDIISSSRRYEHFKIRLAKVLDRTIDIVTKQISLGQFDVGFIEKRFTRESALMKLTGVIDRVDVVKKNGKTYFRIIDYKTGRTEFDIEKVKAGLQLQLAIYTAEAAATLFEDGEQPEAAGMYYYRIDDPIIDAKASTNAQPDIPDSEGTEKTMPAVPSPETEKEIMKKLRMDGLTVGEDDIIGLHDISLVAEDGSRLPGGSSQVIYYECKKDGSLAKNSERKVVDTETFDNVKQTASDKAKMLAGDILKGRVSVDPYEYKSENACNYCPYVSVCKFDKHLGDRFRAI
ncbi:MAG: PD-(D/E)XK nuclease family protein [Lachnospiraceae bacterium]|nr:PD-(D/E)XK nuclease family protein [Lachnospiraceae bacterium]